MIYQPPFVELGDIWPLRWRRRRKSYGFKADCVQCWNCDQKLSENTKRRIKEEENLHNLVESMISEDVDKKSNH